jgi:5-methylthioribose kinase
MVPSLQILTKNEKMKVFSSKFYGRKQLVAFLFKIIFVIWGTEKTKNSEFWKSRSQRDLYIQITIKIEKLKVLS